MNKKIVILILSLVFLGVLTVGVFTVVKLSNPQQKPCIASPKFPYLNVTTGCQPMVINKMGYATLEDDLNSLIQNDEQSDSAADIAVYFRDLENGPVFSINGSEDFAPASLLKVPLAMAFLKLNETNPSILSYQIMYDTKIVVPTSDDLEVFASPVVLKRDQSYTIEELLSMMIEHSDNVSYGLLLNYLANTGQSDLVVKTDQDLGIIDPTNPLDQTLSVSDYSSIFRILYNASYLTPQDSQILLSWLAHTDFDKGLVAELPASVVVAHKFGEREVQIGKTLAPIKQLHDCGIIYYPDNPYLLCVMTRGTDLNKLASIISTISERIYNEVDSRKLQP